MLKKLLKKSPLIVFLVRKLVQWKNIYILNTDIKKEKFISYKFKKKVGKNIDFSKMPKTFSEKIQFRKLYDNNPLYSICADKYRVRKYVKEKIGEEYLVPLYLVTDKLTEEQWEKLPKAFVIKPNHDSATVTIVKDKEKVNRRKIIKNINRALKIDYGIVSMEKYYSDIKERKIIVEKFLENKGEIDLKDYKFFCFSGKVKYCQLIKNRSKKETIDFYDENWKKQEFSGLSVTEISKNIEKKPKKYELMKRLAEQLAESFDFVRIDFYNVEDKIYFGEITFCPASGFGKFIPEKWNNIIGDLWKQKDLRRK